MESQAKGKSRFRRFAAAAGLVVLASAGACLATGDDGAEGVDVTARELAAEGGHHHFRGPVNVMIDAAVAHGNLSAEQDEVLAAIKQEVAEDREGRREMRERLRTSASEIVRSGTADSDQFDQTVDRALAAIELRMGRTADAIEEIHATLDAEQRAAVADVLRDHIAEKFGRRHDPARQRKGFKRFASHLLLSALQIDKLKTLRRELLGEHKRLRPSQDELLALVDAFEGESFSPAVDAFLADKTRIIRERFAVAGERADTVMSIFTPGQRDLIADLIEHGPQKVLFEDKTQKPSE